MHTLQSLLIFGLDPASGVGRRAIALVAEHARWEHAGQRFFDGEVEPCINGRTIETGAYFGVDVAAIVERILDERLADGGWNCEAENGSVVSSFDTTINVLDGLLAVEQATGGSDAVRAARRGGERYLLERGLFRRKSTGEVVDPAYLDAAFPYYWHYDVLRALDYFRRIGATPDPRDGGGRRGRAVQAPARRPLAARPHPSRPCPLRHRGRRRDTQPLEHAPRAARARLVGSGRRGLTSPVTRPCRSAGGRRQLPGEDGVGGRHRGQLGLHPAGRGGERGLAEQPARRLGDRARRWPPAACSASPAPESTSTGAFMNWSAPWGSTRCGQAVVEGGEDRRRAALADDRRAVGQQQLVRREVGDEDVRRPGPERRRVGARADGDEHVDRQRPRARRGRSRTRGWRRGTACRA